jgi:hypothetical protein
MPLVEPSSLSCCAFENLQKLLQHHRNAIAELLQDAIDQLDLVDHDFFLCAPCVNTASLMS